ncbi:lysine histidine transporter-like 8 [Quercus suber]|uniref:Lysine histidine transporter-like 8 n=1 Tax=Quercus suber TaxID=58331 RepID=A0AAW0IHL7_QUESU
MSWNDMGYHMLDSIIHVATLHHLLASTTPLISKNWNALQYFYGLFNGSIYLEQGQKYRTRYSRYQALVPKISRILGVVNAFGFIALALRGHNLILETQTFKLMSRLTTEREREREIIGLKSISVGKWTASMPSSEKNPSQVPMWKGVKSAYLLIAMCLFPLAIGGYWAYGNMDEAAMSLVVSSNFLTIAISCYGSQLQGLSGGFSLPLTLALPSFMWIKIKKPEAYSPMWWFNWTLGLFGMALSGILIMPGVYVVIVTSIKVRFFKPH